MVRRTLALVIFTLWDGSSSFGSTCCSSSTADRQVTAIRLFINLAGRVVHYVDEAAAKKP
jgi:hypothetical protein